MTRALVTGASGGIGSAICRRLAADGLEVIVHGNRNAQRAEDLAAEIRAAGGSAEVALFDVTHAQRTRQCLEALCADEVVQILVNNAGVHADAPMPGMSREQWDEVIDVSLNGFFNVTQPLLMPMISKRWGRIVSISSVSALIYSGQFDLQRTYFLVAGIAGIDPSQGTLGSAAWARFLVDSDLAWEIDAREVPANWPNGFIGINTQGPGQKPPLDYKTEVFRVNEALLQKALALSKTAVLDDNATARAYRANYPSAPANQPPAVVQCDTAAGNTYWHGAKLGEREAAWVKLLTDGQGTYCTTQQEDNASFEALTRGAKAGLLDLQRVAVLRTASNFDRPYPGQTPYDSLVNSHSGGFVPSLNNLYLAGGPLVNDIVTRWSVWKHGVPSP